MAAFGIPYDQCRWRDVSTLSGGEQKRLVLESLLRGTDGVLLLDEPDNYLDVPGKRWLEQQLAATPKTVLLVSHDRELLAACAQRIVTVEDRHVWVHGGGFSGYAQARADRISRLEELRRRWDEEHEKLKELVRAYRQKASYNSDMASRLQAAVTRLRRFEEEGPPQEAPREQNVKMRLRGGRTGKRAVICENLVLTGNTSSFGTEIWFDDRVAILGANGSGKSTFLRLLAGEQVPHEGQSRLGARVVPGFFAQTHARPDLAGRAPVEILMTEHALLINEAMSALARYELQSCARQPFGTLSGGQQARLQILLLELAGSTLLLLDEPTDNLDLPSAEALQQGLESYQGTVLAVTHDRWFARSFERFLIFTSDGNVREATEPAWDWIRGGGRRRLSRRLGCRSRSRSGRRPGVRCRTRCSAGRRARAAGRSPCRTARQPGWAPGRTRTPARPERGRAGCWRRLLLRAPAAAAGRCATWTALTVRRHALLSRGLLGGRLLGLLGRRLLRPEGAGQPEPGPEERPVDSGAALGHALARAERHLALGVVLEAAGQLGVARVLGKLLELLLVLGGEVDVEVAHPGQLHAVGDELAVGRLDGGLLDLRRVRHQAQDRPPVADDLRGDVGPQHLQQLVAHPAGDPLVVGDVTVEVRLVTSRTGSATRSA